jgi:hypothetical protein
VIVPRAGSTNCGRKARKNSASLGFEDVDENALGEQPGRALGLAHLDHLGVLPAQERPYTEVDQVSGADVLDDGEHERRGQQQPGKAGHRRRDLDEGAHMNAQHRGDARACAMPYALRDDVQDSGPGNEQDDGGGGHVQGERRWTRHAAT